MKLMQFYLPDKGKRLGVLTREDRVRDVTSEEASTVLELMQLAAESRVSLSVVLADIQEQLSIQNARRMFTDEETNGILDYDELNVAPDEAVPHLLMPIDPPEVWGAGVTYKRSASMRDEDSEQDIYSRIYEADRPELFFKATASRCVGPNEPICIRSDSKLTATEPELAYVIGPRNQIVGYTICNDVSAWDIERDNPLYLPQSKIYKGCCALGPMFVTAQEVPDVYDLGIECRILRDDVTIYEGSANSSQIKRTFDEINEYLCRDNPVPLGTVVSTGTGIIVPNDLPLQAGDVVEISIDELGTLSNPVKQL